MPGCMTRSEQHFELQFAYLKDVTFLEMAIRRWRRVDGEPPDACSGRGAFQHLLSLRMNVDRSPGQILELCQPTDVIIVGVSH